MHDERHSPRIPLDHHVLVSHPAFETFCLRMRDMSGEGVFLLSPPDERLVPGLEVTLQVRDLEEAPLVRAQVVRIEDEGVALRFLLGD